ncbi:hypothetical protein AB0C81_03660 [Streptomyces roseoverticillatus]|uniref:hypothetical protein n=1 Tax=Streptomyces roseoverticillatus TaxID=66429 RepID=UPI0033E07B66
MAKRKVHRRARKILGEEPVALVWCGLNRDIPKPPKDVHRAAGKGRLKPGHHWMVVTGMILGCAVFIPWMLLDMFGQWLDRVMDPRTRRRPAPAPDPAPRFADADNPGADDQEQSRDAASSGPDDLFDGDWNLAAGQLLLRWYGHSPNRKRLVLLTGDRVCVAASRGRRLSPTKADDFGIVAEFPHHEARVQGTPGTHTFLLAFPDGSWLRIGNLTRGADADAFLRTVSA